MSRVSRGVSTETTPNAASSYRETAQQRIEELRSWRDQIPRFVIPESSNAVRRLTRAASVPPEFVELASVAVTNHPVLAHTAAMPSSDINDLMTYAQAFAPVADELEVLTKLIRYSTKAARHAAGSQALATYGVATFVYRRTPPPRQ